MKARKKLGESLAWNAYLVSKKNLVEHQTWQLLSPNRSEFVLRRAKSDETFNAESIIIMIIIIAIGRWLACGPEQLVAPLVQAHRTHARQGFAEFLGATQFICQRAVIYCTQKEKKTVYEKIRAYETC